MNWHLISACNYSCRFCFARNLGETPVSFSEGERILTRLADAGMEKINFAGGEPLLHPRLFDYCRAAHDLGMTVSITTNGSRLTPEQVRMERGYIDWIALSVDSASEETEVRLGRGDGRHVGHCIRLSDAIREAGIRLKINTTVTALSREEDMTGFIRRTDPDRWKVLQMLHIRGENDGAVADLSVTDAEFRAFADRHTGVVLRGGVLPVFESSAMIEGSYFMVTPGGRVKTDTGRVIRKYSLDEVLESGVSAYVDEGQYLGRGGVYAW
ncbi:viperin family antiviral radical SAM protein [Methanofollis tationis]|uniref:viperin family antiviral radical SAM protein n=1 Tax=Methanofollis tationis TaxID=81417 RepID=UPI0031B5E2EB